MLVVLVLLILSVIFIGNAKDLFFNDLHDELPLELRSPEPVISKERLLVNQLV